MSVQWSGLDNFTALWRDGTYLESFKTTALFSVFVAGLGDASNQLTKFVRTIGAPITSTHRIGTELSHDVLNPAHVPL